jgi:hypothetical protein
LEKAAGKANSEVQFSDIAKQVGRFDNPWLLYSKYIDAVDKNCVETMSSKCKDRLEGAQEFMSTHSFAITEAGKDNPSVNAILQNNIKIASPT